MKNLLQETVEVLFENNKIPNDVKWVGTREIKFTWDKFAELSNEEYDNGYGGQLVASNLIIVGDNWWLERHEYDGSEWWEFKEMPITPERDIVPIRVIGGMWDGLQEINREDY